MHNPSWSYHEGRANVPARAKCEIRIYHDQHFHMFLAQVRALGFWRNISSKTRRVLPNFLSWTATETRQRKKPKSTPVLSQCHGSQERWLPVKATIPWPPVACLEDLSASKTHHVEQSVVCPVKKLERQPNHSQQVSHELDWNPKCMWNQCWHLSDL